MKLICAGIVYGSGHYVFTAFVPFKNEPHENKKNIRKDFLTKWIIVIIQTRVYFRSFQIIDVK